MKYWHPAQKVLNSLIRSTCNSRKCLVLGISCSLLIVTVSAVNRIIAQTINLQNQQKQVFINPNTDPLLQSDSRQYNNTERTLEQNQEHPYQFYKSIMLLGVSSTGLILSGILYLTLKSSSQASNSETKNDRSKGNSNLDHLLTLLPDLIEVSGKDGSLFWNELFISPVFNTQGQLTNFIGIQNDISERKQSEAALKESQARLKTIIAATSDALVVVNRQGMIRFVNPAAEVLFGRSESVLLTYWIGNFLVQEDRTELMILQPEGKQVIAEMRAVEIEWEGEKATLASLRDISERKQAEEKLRHSAFYDALTNLPNRALFMNELEDAIAQTKSLNSVKFAVVFFDLDRFKFVNESLGYIIGDQLLVEIARRLKNCLRPTDTLARLGGDEFTVLLRDIEEVNQAIAIVQKLQHQFTFPFNLSDHQLFSSASMGIALITPDYIYPEELLRDADIAMYSAKKQGKNCYAIFKSKMRKKSQKRLRLETDLRYAGEKQEFSVYYQPIVCLTTSKIVGFEALVRWTHPTHNLISPSQFIPVSEETGLILELGYWVMETACNQLKFWHQKYPSMQDLTMSINLSSRQIQEYDFVENTNKIITKAQVNPKKIKLELTESILMEKPEAVKEKLKQIRSQQIRLSLDDFGTGYSSLSYLHHFPINTLKIDRSFILRMNFKPEYSVIVQTIITLAHTLGMDVIAEGIETVEHLEHLQTLDCEYGQGYLFSKPVSAVEAEQLLESQHLRIQ